MLNCRNGGVMKVTCSFLSLKDDTRCEDEDEGAMMMNLLVMYYLPLGAPVR